MRLVVVAFGSRGDVQPYVALGRGLQAAGYAVTLCTLAEFEPLVRDYGLGFAPMRGNIRAILATEPGQRLLQAGRNPIALLSAMARLFETAAHELVEDCWQACRDTDAILYSLLAWFGIHHVVEKLHLPKLAVYLQPVSPTREFAIMGAAGGRLGGAFNLVTYAINQQISWMLIRGALNVPRRNILDLPPEPFWAPFGRMHREHMPILYGYSPLVLPKPADWGDWIDVTGYWILEPRADWQPPAALVDFLRTGPPPVYVGFGSMRDRAPSEGVDLALGALRRAGQRGILLADDEALAGRALPDSMIAASGIPHEWLFPQMAAVAHHCGAGTTAAGLRAGVPTITVPYFGDQPLWAERIHALGAGTRPIQRKRLTADNLAAAIQVATTDAAMRQRAADLGARLRAEDGVARAVECIRARLGGMMKE